MSQGDLRPYELQGEKYALWYDVGVRVGTMAQAAVLTGLNDPHHRVPREAVHGTEELISVLAKQRGVFLQFI